MAKDNDYTNCYKGNETKFLLGVVCGNICVFRGWEKSRNISAIYCDRCSCSHIASFFQECEVCLLLRLFINYFFLNHSFVIRTRNLENHCFARKVIQIIQRLIKVSSPLVKEQHIGNLITIFYFFNNNIIFYLSSLICLKIGIIQSL